MLVIFATTISACKHANNSGYPIILLVPRSGAQSALGLQIDRARIIVEQELRDANDNTVSIHEVDTTSQPTVARAEAERALDHYHAKFLVGSVLSGETRNFLQSVLSKNVVVLANGSSDPTIRTLPYRHAGDGFFRNWPPDDAEGKAMAEFVHFVEQKKTLAVFCADDAYARALTTTFVRRFRELGGFANDPQIYSTSATSFESILDRVDASHTDGYYIVGLPRDLAGMYNTIRRTPSGKSTLIFTAVAAETSEFKALVNQPLNNLFYTSPSSDLTSSQYFRFKEAYKKQFKSDDPDIVASITYDALHIAINAVEQSRNDPDRAKSYLYSMPPYPGTTGPTKFDSMGDVISKPVAIHFYENGLSRLAKTPSFGGSAK
jgi:ABC-type branched-subunit amino acid transport system substrate-binding protein